MQKKNFNFPPLRVKNILIFFVPVLLVILMCLSDIIFFCQNGKYALAFAIPFRILLLLLIPLPLFKNHIRWYAIIPAVFAFIGIFACFPVIYFNTRITESIISLVWQTNYQEARELISGYIGYILLALSVLTALLIYLIKQLPVSVKGKSALAASLLSIAILAGTPYLTNGGNNYKEKAIDNIVVAYPFYIRYTLRRFLTYHKNILDYKANVKNFKFDISSKDSLKQRQIYILTIGEASRYDHWGINGYARNTSPHLDTLSDLLSFKDVSAAGAITEMSVPLIITQATPDDYLKHTHEKSIVSLFKEAGFYTYWITDQDDNGDIRIHENESDSVISLKAPYQATKNVYRDMDLVDSLKKVLAGDNHNLFIVIHTLGSHWDYRVRYPPNFDIFKPSGEGKFLNFDRTNKETLINAYDNTILYSDAVLDSIIHLSDIYSKVSFMVYLSDHGENLFDDSRNFILHAIENVSKYSTHIPLFIRTSNGYDRIYPNKVMWLKKHINNKISGYDMFETLADMANIHFERENLRKSLASSEYQNSRQKIALTPGKYIYYSDLKGDTVTEKGEFLKYKDIK